MTSKSTIIVLLPSNLNLSEVEKSSNVILRKVMKDKIYVFLDSITKPLRKKTLSLDPYTILKASSLKSMYGDCYKEMIDFLLLGDVIECNNRYIVGKQSKGYRFTEKYRNSLPSVHKVSNSTLVNKIVNNSISIPNNYPHLNVFTDGLVIDLKGAEEYCFSTYNSKVKQFVIDVDNYLEIARQFYNPDIDIPVNPIFWLYSQLRVVHSIHHKQFRFKVDETGYRLHTNLTNIKSELRNFITFNGVKLVSVDYSNSQPLLSTLFLKNSYWNAVKQNSSELHYTDIRCKEDEVKFINDIIRNIKSSTYTMIPTFTKSSDIETYVSLCEIGKIYEYIQQELNLSDNSREAVKVAVFQILFTDNRFIGQEKAEPKRAFKRLFPDVYKVLSLIKKGNSKLLPILLQRIESEIILNRVAKRIEIERPDLPLFTIHDSVVTSVGNELYIQFVMKEEMENAIGLSPNMKIEYWKPENIDLQSDLVNVVA